jgi:hypothetical protein
MIGEILDRTIGRLDQRLSDGAPALNLEASG